MQRQHDHHGHGEAGHSEPREGMQQPPHMRGPQPGQAGRWSAGVRAPLVVDRLDEAKLVQCRHEVCDGEGPPALRAQSRRNLTDDSSMAEQFDDAVGDLGDGDEVSGLDPADHPLAAIAARAEAAEPDPRSIIDGSGRRRVLCHGWPAVAQASQSGCGWSSRTSGAPSAPRFIVSIRPGTIGDTSVSTPMTR